MVGTLAVLVVPGMLLARLLRFRMSALATWAAVPVLSIATVFVLGEVTSVPRVPFGSEVVVIDRGAMFTVMLS